VTTPSAWSNGGGMHFDGVASTFTCTVQYSGFQTFRTQAFRTLGVSNPGPNLDPNRSSNPKLLTLTPNPNNNTNPSPNPNPRYLTLTLFKNVG